MKKFNIIKTFLGYQNKKDPSNTDPRYLVKGSQDVIVVDSEKIKTRGGSSLDGGASTDRFPIISSYDWVTSTASERNLRSLNQKLQFRYVAADGTVSYVTLKDGFTSVRFRFDAWWSSAEKKDLLLFVNGTSSIYMWSGAVVTVASNTATTLTLQGTATWAESRFLLAGTRKVIINGVEYGYTGGEGTTTLTGLAGLPAIPVGTVVAQAVIETVNIPASGVSNDLIFVSKNQVYLGDEQRRDVYVSKNTSYTDYTFSVPRLVGEGVVLTLDSCPTGFIDQENAVYISAGRDDWYQVTFTQSSDLINETVAIEKLKSGPQQAARSQEAIGKIKNSVIYISQEPTLDSLGRIENINTPQAKPLSDPVKFDFDDYDFTGCHVKFFKNQTFITVPVEHKVLIYDHSNSYWQPPQTMDISRLAIIAGELYGHSSVVSETYKIFDDTLITDNDNAINNIAQFAYRNFDRRDWKKRFDEYFHEGYLLEGTVIDVDYFYEYQGSETQLNKKIDSKNEKTIFSTGRDTNTLGGTPFGSMPLGTNLAPSDSLIKFRVIHSLNKTAFYEYYPRYSSNTAGYKWQLLAQGPNVILSVSDNVSIKT